MRTPTALVAALALFALLTATPRSSAAADDGGPIRTSDLRKLHALSVFGHGQFVPNALLSVALAQSTELTSGGFGLAYTYRRGTLDVVTSLDFSFFTPPDGNYLALGDKKPEFDTSYVQFRNLNFLSLDVSFYWVHDISRYIAFMIGGGIGIGAVLGDVIVTHSGPQCTKANIADPSQCHPVVTQANYMGDVGGKLSFSPPNPAPTWTDANGGTNLIEGPIVPGSADFQRKLDGLQASQADCRAKGGGDCRDTALHPYTHVASEKPPVMVVINFQIGFKLKLHRHFNFNIMGGFRNGLVVGGGPEIVF